MYQLNNNTKHIPYNDCTKKTEKIVNILLSSSSSISHEQHELFTRNVSTI